MRWQLTTLVFQSLLLLAAASDKYCSGDYSHGGDHCKKFEFDSTTDEEKCGSSSGSKHGDNSVNGIKLSNCTTFYDISDLPDQDIDDHTTKMAQLITNVFENGGTSIGYGYVENIKDCRGYTSGYIGFTTGTNDAYTVVKQYLKHNPKSKLRKSLKELKRLSQLDFGDSGRADTSKLDKHGYMKAWQHAACYDARFIQTQLDVGHAMYLKPAMKYAASVGVHSNLGKAFFYDTIVQHGWQYVEPQINLPRILHLTGARRANESEKDYLARFLKTRRQLQCCSPSSVWNESADRVSDLQKLLEDWDRNKDLKHPVKLDAFGVTVKGTEDLLYDSENCKHKPKHSKGAKPTDLPIPDTCPNPLMS